MPKSPLAAVKDRFGSKQALIEAVQKLMSDKLWIDRLDTDKGLDAVSNKKLLHLHDVLARLQKDLGSRAKLIEAIAQGLRHAKDAGYIAILERYPTPRLLAVWTDLQRRAKPSTAKG